MADDKAKADPHPGMMGDGTEEQGLGQTGDPGARITEDEVKDAFGGAEGAKGEPTREGSVTPSGASR